MIVNRIKKGMMNKTPEIFIGYAFEEISFFHNIKETFPKHKIEINTKICYSNFIIFLNP